MDPSPQAHAGVGHDPEYTMPVQAGQLAVTMWTHGDSERRRSQREPAPASAWTPARAPASARAGPPSVASAAT